MNQPDESTQTETSAPSASTTPTAARSLHLDSEAWQRRAGAVGGWVSGQLHRPRTRLAVIGVLLLVIAALGIVGTVWTLPLVIVGVVMLLVAWIGSRLDGRFAIEWGESGTQLEFRAQIKAPPAPPQRVLTGVAKTKTAPQVPAVRIPTLAEIEHGDVIEGEGHTVEIDVAELKALISAAESGERVAAESAERRGPAPQRGPTDGRGSQAA